MTRKDRATTQYKRLPLWARQLAKAMHYFVEYGSTNVLPERLVHTAERRGIKILHTVLLDNEGRDSWILGMHGLASFSEKLDFPKPRARTW